MEQSAVRATRAGRIGVHAHDARRREQGAYFFFDALRAIAERPQFVRVTLRALLRDAVCGAADVTAQRTVGAVHDERNRAAPAARRETASATEQQPRVSPSVHEEQRLLSAAQRGIDRGDERRPE